MKTGTVKVVSQVVNVFYRFSRHIRRGWKQNPKIGDPSDWIRKIVSAQPKTWENGYTSLETWIIHFLRVLFVKWGHEVPLLVTNNLPLKFGSKWSTMKIWIFRAPGSGFRPSLLEIEMALELKFHVFLEFSNFIWNPIKEMNKTQKAFRKRRSFVFQLILLIIEFLLKFSKSWIQTVIPSWDKIHKGNKIFEFWLETLTIPQPYESATLTNWRHWKRTFTRPIIHLPIKTPSLEHSFSRVGQLLERGVLGYPRTFPRAYRVP